MTKHTLHAQTRTLVGRKVKQLRRQGIVPASIYGKSATTANVQLEAKIFNKFRSQVGESSLVYLNVAGESAERPVIIREVTVDPVSGQLSHIAFNQVSLKEKVTAPVPVKIEGESPAERDKLGILVTQTDEVEIEALPTDIPEAFIVDVSTLAEVDSAITVADLRVDTSKITIKTDPDTIIVKVEPLAAEEVVEAPAADASADSPAEAAAEEGAPAKTESAPAAE